MTEPLAFAAATITAEDIARHIHYLAGGEATDNAGGGRPRGAERHNGDDDAGDCCRGALHSAPEMASGGADATSSGSERAAAYLAGAFHAMGLEAAGDSGTYLQRLPQVGSGLDPATFSFFATGTQGSDMPVFGSDFFVLPSAVSSVSAPLVWAGVAAPGRQPPGPDAAGRVMAFYLPGVYADETWQATLSTTVRGSVSAGAAAVMFVLDPKFAGDGTGLLAPEPFGEVLPGMVVGLRYATAQKVFRNGLRDLDQLRHGTNRIVPVTGTTVTLRADRGFADVRPPNVVAVLPGSDPVLKDTHVVFSAPVGPDRDRRGDPASGANDASGAAALIEIAEAFASLPSPPARSLIFLGVGRTHDEPLGSRHFVANAPVPAKQIVAGISVDRVADTAPGAVAAIGQHYTSLGELAHETASAYPELGLAIASDLSPEDDRFFSSDPLSFARIDVPAILFTAGARAAEPLAHDAEPDDTTPADADRLARVARLVFYFGHTLGTRVERPMWTAEGRAAVQRNEH